LIDAISSP